MAWATKEAKAEYQRRYRAAKKAIDPDFENRQAREYRAKNPKAHTAASMKWAKKNPEKVKAIARRTYQNNKERRKEAARAYASSEKVRAAARARGKLPEFRAKRNAYLRARRAADPAYKMRYYLRNQLRAYVNGSKSARFQEIVGCSIEQLREHIERQFDKRMTWSNWSVAGWHIDHIRPLNAFDLSRPEEVKAAWHFTNLRPLWAKENRLKSDRFLLLC